MDKLTISAQTMEAFSESSVKRYEDKMIGHLRALFGERIQELPDPVVRRVVQCGIARAERYGFVQEDNVCSYIDMMFAYGRDFDTVMPWARQLLVDSTITDPLVRADRLYSTAIDNIHTARGISREEAESAVPS